MEPAPTPTIGLIVLDSDRNVVAQHRMLLPERVRIETEPVELKDGIVTNAALAAMFDSDQLEIAARKLAERGAQRLCFCCTSGSLVNGPGWDSILIDRIESAAGVPGSTTSTAVLAALRAIGAHTIAIGTPYIAEVDDRERAFFTQAGFAVAALEGLGCDTDPEIAARHPGADRRAGKTGHPAGGGRGFSVVHDLECGRRDRPAGTGVGETRRYQ